MLCWCGRGHQGASHPSLAQKPRCLELKGPSVAVNSLRHINKRRRPRTKPQLWPGPSHWTAILSPAAAVTAAACWPLPPSEPCPLPLQCSPQCQSCPAPLPAQVGVTRPLKLRPFSVAPVKSTILLPVSSGGGVTGWLPVSLRLFLGPN